MRERERIPTKRPKLEKVKREKRRMDGGQQGQYYKNNFAVIELP